MYYFKILWSEVSNRFSPIITSNTQEDDSLWKMFYDKAGWELVCDGNRISNIGLMREYKFCKSPHKCSLYACRYSVDCKL